MCSYKSFFNWSLHLFPSPFIDPLHCSTKSSTFQGDQTTLPSLQTPSLALSIPRLSLSKPAISVFRTVILNCTEHNSCRTSTAIYRLNFISAFTPTGWKSVDVLIYLEFQLMYKVYFKTEFVISIYVEANLIIAWILSKRHLQPFSNEIIQDKV